MKKSTYIYILGLIFCIAAGLSSCNTDKLKEMDNPKYMLTAEKIDLGYMFTNVMVEYARRAAYQGISQPSGYVKYYATHSMIATGDRYVHSAWDQGWNPYTTEGKMAIHLLGLLENVTDYDHTNNIAILEILKGAIFQFVTDSFGDVPYSEACLALLTGELYPKYDTQESIYKSILAMLDGACNSLNASKPVWGKYDIIYGGNISQWKKFGYSLMLRMAMRMSAVDATTARTYAEKAIAGGVILDNADNFKIICADNRTSDRNPVAQGFIFSDPEKYWKLGEYFVDALKDKDPRAQVIFGGRLKRTNPVAQSGWMNARYWFDDNAWDYSIEDAKGYPHGARVQTHPYEQIQWEYTRQSRYLWDYGSNWVRLAAHEMYFCIAKAAEMGWNTGGRTAEAMYNAAITANMKFYAQFANTHVITDAEIANYLAYRPYSADNLLRELWIANYMDPFESWSYVRQWGPDLPTNVVGMRMPRRFAYIQSERTRNVDNYNDALKQMGMPSDVTNQAQMQVRVWCDVRPLL